MAAAVWPRARRACSGSTASGAPAGGTGRWGFRPRRIVLVRHGQSAGNVNEACYTRTPDWQIPLTPLGVHEARDAGRALRALMREPGANAYFYHSPYRRARETLDGILGELEPEVVIGVREEPRISEQQFGNLQSVELMRNAKEEREHFGRFYYRFPSGESALDVYNRVSSFIATLFRDVEQMRERGVLTPETHLVIVAHGLAARTFLMRWFQLTVADFEMLSNQPNGSLLVMERQTDGHGHQWYELTREAWQLLNAEGRIPSGQMKAGGHPGAGHRCLVAGHEPLVPDRELDG